jgi:hypothetical protein
MANTYTLIESQTLGSNQASVTLGVGGTIPQTYTDLQVLYSARSSTGSGYANNLFTTFNGATSRYYEYTVYLAGTSLGSTSKSNADPYFNWVALAQGAETDTWSTGQFYIPNYTSSIPKSISVEWTSEGNSNQVWMMMNGATWNPTSNVPITSITFTHSNILAGSTFQLYGIKNS